MSKSKETGKAHRSIRLHLIIGLAVVVVLAGGGAGTSTTTLRNRLWLAPKVSTTLPWKLYVVDCALTPGPGRNELAV